MIAHNSNYIYENTTNESKHNKGWSTLIGDTAYVWIPKNCSSYFRDQWPENQINCKTQKTKNYVVILRDPVDKFISVMSHYLNIEKKDYNDFKNNWEYYTSNYFDVHVAPQHWFIDYLESRNNVFYYIYNKNVIEQINLKHNFTHLDVHPIINEGRNDIKKRIKNLVYARTEIFNSITKNYREDYKLLTKTIPNWRNML